MKIHVLGCFGPYPAPGEATSGYLVEAAGKRILLDCGAGVAGKLMKIISPAQLDCAVFSHLHYDHMSDISVISYHFQLHGGVLPVYLPPEEQSFRREILNVPMLKLIDEEDKFEIGDIMVETMPVKHPVPCRAIRITAEGKCFAFTGDTNVCDGLANFCRDADVLLADSAFTDSAWGESKPHMSARHCAALAKEAGAKQLYLTHINPDNDPDELLKEARESVSGAKIVTPGLCIEI